MLLDALDPNGLLELSELVELLLVRLNEDCELTEELETDESELDGEVLDGLLELTELELEL